MLPNKRLPTCSVLFGISFMWLVLNYFDLIHAEKSLCWPFNFVPYRINPEFTPYQRKYIKQQIDKIHNNTCIYWSDIDESETLSNLNVFVLFKRNWYGICLTAILYPFEKRKLKVTITLSDYCFEERYVLHEIVHALGFDHEHQRRDRDCYVWVSEAAKKSSSYEIDNYFAIPTIDRFPYDKKSIMHYQRTSNLKALSERWYEWEPLGNDEERLTYLDLWKIQYRFCGRPHYCEVHAEQCRYMEQIESEKNCNVNRSRGFNRQPP